MLCQLLLDAVHHLQRHPMAFPQLWRTVWAVQHEYGLTICCDDVDMGGSVIVHIDSHAQAIEAKDSWHWWVYNLIAWVFQEAAKGCEVYVPISCHLHTLPLWRAHRSHKHNADRMGWVRQGGEGLGMAVSSG